MTTTEDSMTKEECKSLLFALHQELKPNHYDNICMIVLYDLFAQYTEKIPKKVVIRSLYNIKKIVSKDKFFFENTDFITKKILNLLQQ